MGGPNKGALKPQPVSSIFVVLVYFFSFRVANNASAQGNNAFCPAANYLIDCGSQQETKLDDGRVFKSDRDFTSALSTKEDILISVDSISVNDSPRLAPSSIPLYRTARVFLDDSTYKFYLAKTGRIWIRLYFFPLPHPSYNLTDAVFSVQTDRFLLLHDFSARDNKSPVFKEYLINVSDPNISLQFKPKKNSFAFVNAVEVVSVPDSLISDTATTVSPVGDYRDLSASALQLTYRVNVGGPIITPNNDTLFRTWEADIAYDAFPEGAQNVSMAPNVIKYPHNGGSHLIAPNWVYATAMVMMDPLTMQPNFNLTWKFQVEDSYSYLIRMHFCDIVSSSLNQLYFNVYINEMMGVSSLDLSAQTNALATAFYKDFVLNAATVTNRSIMIQVGPADLQQGLSNAILNGVEIMKMSNSANSLDSLFSVTGSYKGPSNVALKIAAGVGLAMGLVAMLLLLSVYIRWQKRPHGWEKSKSNSFSSWLLPLNASQSSILSSKGSSKKSSIYSSRKSKNGSSGYYSPSGLGRLFTFSELQKATHNFDDKSIIGVGGFGKVYCGKLDDGTMVAIKRGNPGSDQGINEFKNEIDMLSKLRHRHLVSLIGFCDEKSEMILVYEYMAYGSLRDHLHGSNKACLSWKQRLEICIGAARGLHYLHTGAAQGIVHRDVKTTNILLDENFVAKVSDFGLSKAVPDKAHVSTAVKGSLGYLDPEYFRSQQLTEKSDAYSFGVVLFEVLCARPALSPALPREKVNLAEWAMESHKRGNLDKIIDSHIVSTIQPQSLKKFVEAAEKCLTEYGVDRPGMGDVLWNLEYALQLQEASAQSGPSEDNSAKFIQWQQPVETSNKRVDTPFSTSDDSDVTATGVDSALFSRIKGFQGR